MSKKQTTDLLKFLEAFPETVVEKVLWLRAFVWDLYPEANELIYDNYNALAFGWSHTNRLGHTFGSIAVYRSNHNIHFGFYRGSQIQDPEKMLLGNGNQYRYILVGNKKDFPKTYIKKLLREAYVNSLSKVKDISQLKQGLTITKSVLANKRKPGAKTAAKK